MYTVTQPNQMNETFARAFNSRKPENLQSLYEPDALLQGSVEGPCLVGIYSIREMLTDFVKVPGHMKAVNNFCFVHGDLALLRADWTLTGEDGSLLASGSSAEIIRRQPAGNWLYVIDHAVGATVPRVI